MTKEAGIILGNALIWGAVLVGCAVALRGTGQFQEIQAILGGGATASFFVVGMVAVKPKQKSEPPDQAPS